MTKRPEPKTSGEHWLARIPVLYSLLALLLAKRTEVVGWSMSPALLPGEFVLFDTLAYRLGRPQRGDVVLARDPRDDLPIVKRVVGAPGDRIEVNDAGCRVNGVHLTASADSPPQPVLTFTGALAEDEYFLLGDAPGMSTDSRHFGPVAGRGMEGRAWLVYWPLGRYRTVEE